MKRINWFSLILGIFITLAIISACSHWPNRSPTDTQSATARVSTSVGANEIAYSKLPVEAQNVIVRIKSRGTFEFAQDGKTFQNREKILPEQARGYYQEYTVVTPNADNRGARRIVAGKGQTGDVASAGEFYYTSDHYRHFYRVKE